MIFMLQKQLFYFDENLFQKAFCHVEVSHIARGFRNAAYCSYWIILKHSSMSKVSILNAYISSVYSNKKIIQVFNLFLEGKYFLSYLIYDDLKYPWTVIARILYGSIKRYLKKYIIFCRKNEFDLRIFSYIMCVSDPNTICLNQFCL